ncbi:enoyl-CoA hydratase domain-containing protein 2, mitochondrial [Elysia marginata]|uniref:Enoyl-CoA hydratase domain-containing protein 2, mitochondrial n=1 Tax=Elysia marginata TaxID=1093978 RepID=A0AAV4JUE1_9GAST|nr:enoyl-CoA hydratase domain-containing protein 2, mitochondrial [Elysia marginata]
MALAGTAHRIRQFQIVTSHFINKGAAHRSMNRRQSSTYSFESSEKYFQIKMLDGDRNGLAVMSMKHHKGVNSMGYSFMRQFLESMEELRLQDHIRALVLRSDVPKIFCAGADLKERLVMPIPEVYGFVAMLRRAVTELHNLPMPTIAAIDGAALGGGLEIALGCDLRVAASNAKIGLVETSLAIFPGAGGTQRLPRLVGPSVAKELIFTSRRLNGWQALDKGVVNDCVDQNEAGDAAFHRSLELADEILPNGPLAVRMAKLAINNGIEVDIDSGMAYEEAYYARVIFVV